MFCLIAAFTSAARRGAYAGLKLSLVGREKFVHGELYFPEGLARIVRVTAAFLIGYAEVVCRYQHLDVALKLNYRENTYCNRNGFFDGTVAEIVREFVAERAFHAGRDRNARVTETVAAVARAAEPCFKANRIGDLYFCSRICVLRNDLPVARVRSEF